ncbi:iron-sulfur cluster assembly protein [Sphingomonas sp. 1P06PA]|uniref:metal-sulfur cluster assembly factor n=1 Tax=Sphingomonas sp. 1P06PA TaxID=554121 RepID=UPI0039A6AF73
MPEPTLRAPSAAAIRRVLDEIHDPCSLAGGVPLGLDEMGLIDRIDISDDGAIEIRLRLTAPFCHMIGYFKTEATQRVMALPGVTAVALIADNGLDWAPERMSEAAQAKRAAHLARMMAARSAAAA